MEDAEDVVADGRGVDGFDGVRGGASAAAAKFDTAPTPAKTSSPFALMRTVTFDATGEPASQVVVVSRLTGSARPSVPYVSFCGSSFSSWNGMIFT